MRKFLLVCLLVLVATAVIAHPHFRKSTTATLPGDVEISVSFFTVPSNESHIAGIADGDFVSPGLPQLVIPKDMKAGSATIPAGNYTVGAIKNSMTDWTMALSPGKLGFGDSPDMSKLIKLDSQFVKSPTNIGHLVVDIQPGHDKLEGKVVVFIGFGTFHLSGAISDPPTE